MSAIESSPFVDIISDAHDDVLSRVDDIDVRAHISSVTSTHVTQSIISCWSLSLARAFLAHPYRHYAWTLQNPPKPSRTLHPSIHPSMCAENSRPGIRPSTSLSLRSLYVGKHCANAPAKMSSTPPKDMGFHFIGDISYRSKMCFDKMNLDLCGSMHISGE